jgi:hypothetical protein
MPTLTLGRCAFGQGSASDCEARILWDIKHGKLHVLCEIVGIRHDNTLFCGRNVDFVARMFPADKLAERISRVNKAWNDKLLSDDVINEVETWRKKAIERNLSLKTKLAVDYHNLTCYD